MARSYKLPILKDKPRNYKRTSAYWRPIRRVWKQIISCYKYEEEVYPLEEEYLTENEFLNRYASNDIESPNPKTIINDYDYCDNTDDYRFCHKQSKKWWRVDKEELQKDKIKYSRK